MEKRDRAEKKDAAEKRDRAEKKDTVEKRVAVLAIIVQSRESVGSINAILHENADYIIGRMGLPHREKNMNIISVIFDAPADVINAASGKIGRLEGVSAKTLYAGVEGK